MKTGRVGWAAVRGRCKGQMCIGEYRCEVWMGRSELVWEMEGTLLTRPVSLYAAAAAAKSLQSCPTLCDHIDGSPLGSSVPGILQARILEWVTTSFSNAWKWKVKVKSLSRVWLLATPWTAAYQAPPSMEFSRQEYWSGVPLPSPPADPRLPIPSTATVATVSQQLGHLQVGDPESSSHQDLE